MGRKPRLPDDDVVTTEVPIVPEAIAERINDELRMPPPPRPEVDAAAIVNPFVAGTLRAALPELQDDSPSATPRSWGAAPNQPRRAQQHAKVRSLEELYALVPELAQGKGRMRVDRTEPKWIDDPGSGKLRVSGTLGYLESPISTEDFYRRFGGYQYNVYALVYSDPPDNRGGPPQETVRAVAELESPLHPNLEYFPIADSIEDEMSGYYRFNPRMMQPPVVVQQQQPQLQQSVPIDPVLQFASRAMEQASRGNHSGSEPNNVVRDLTQQSMGLMERQLQDRETEVRELRDKLSELANRPTPESNVLGSMAQVIAAMKGSASSEEMRQLRDQMESQIERTRSDHERDLERLRTEHSRDVERAHKELENERRRAQERESDLRAAAEKQERASRDELDRRLRDKDEAFDRRERDLRADHDRALARLKEAYESRIADMDRAHQSESRLHEMNSNSMSQTKDITANTRIESLQQQLSEARAERELARERLRALEAEANKPFMDRFLELKQLAEATGITNSAADVAGAAPEGATPTERLLGQLITSVGPRLPQLLGQVAAVATGRGVQPQQPPAQGPQHVQSQVIQQQPARSPQPQRQRLMFADTDGAPIERTAAPEHLVIPPQPAAPPPIQAPPQQPQPQPEQQAVAQTQPPQQAEPPWNGFEWTNLDADSLGGVFGLIAQGAASNTSHAEVVDQLEAKFGQPIVAAIPTMAAVDRVIASVRKAPVTRQSILATPQGRAYIRGIWQTIIKRSEPSKEG